MCGVGGQHGDNVGGGGSNGFGVTWGGDGRRHRKGSGVTWKVKGHVGSYERRAEVTWEVRGHVGRGELRVHGGVKGHM